ncbi:hypothetical protein COO91_06531 [Nostoc flagelliforme CCNUN1]|uniref:Uncharacterized protein n=1 Tax=Nostoc flagelliforme CCNUN1 TaxID=2038116 RepID=A0A2K8SYI9_9NOSO|nr:hypothetical protein COO91_06531 [Nostoc flagelliforme CCNUN1]
MCSNYLNKWYKAALSAIAQIHTSIMQRQIFYVSFPNVVILCAKSVLSNVKMYGIKVAISDY